MLKTALLRPIWGSFWDFSKTRFHARNYPFKGNFRPFSYLGVLRATYTLLQLIQKDEIDEFIIFVNQTNYPLSSEIKQSIFETNNLLIKKKPTLIEYSVFYGAIQIFKYLYMNDVKLTRSLFIYAIHGRNNEIIHFLEENVDDISIEECIFESIKCHHEELFDYFMSKYENKINHSILLHSIQYYNYSNFDFNENFNDEQCFKYLCKYNYIDIVKSLLKRCQFDLKSSMMAAAKKGNIEIASLLIDKFGIPKNAFFNCQFLTEITIPSSVTAIESRAFSNCHSLTRVTFPLSVTAVGEDAFSVCSSLLEVELPNVSFIGGNAFYQCSSLTEVKLPSSMSEIESGAFKKCTSLRTINFPSSLNRMGDEIFSDCSSLIEIIFPSSIKEINQSTFARCKSLKRI